LKHPTDLHELEYHDPETLWLMILMLHRKDKSARVHETLAAGPVEDLLAKHGEGFIDRIAKEPRKDPLFAKLLGGGMKEQYDG